MTKTARPAHQARPPRGPFYQPFDVRSLKGGPSDIAVAASAEQRAAVAQAIGLENVASLEASFHLVPRTGGRVELQGHVDAKVTQTCVVSLEPFESVVRQEVTLDFVPEAETSPDSRGRGGRVELEAKPPPSIGGNDDQQDPPEQIRGDTIDLGAIAVEFMVLGLEPYPRKPGVHFDDMVVGEKEAPLPSAFSALARLKDGS